MHVWFPGCTGGCCAEVCEFTRHVQDVLVVAVLRCVNLLDMSRMCHMMSGCCD